jgi:hypothetical protein
VEYLISCVNNHLSAVPIHHDGYFCHSLMNDIFVAAIFDDEQKSIIVITLVARLVIGQ